MRQSHTSTIELGTTWEGAFATEPQECAWATEALFFIRVLEGSPPAGAVARVELGPDGIHWCPEGTEVRIPAAGPAETTCARVREFGGWLRLAGSLPAGTSLQVLVHLVLKE